MRLESQLSRGNCQTFSTGLSSGARGGSGIRVMLPGDDEVLGDVPFGLVEQHDGVRVGGNGGCDFGEVQGHRCGIATRHDDRRRLALGRADRAEEIGRGGPLILRRRGAGAAPRPASGDAG
jgi:hypothetical protein